MTCGWWSSSGHTLSTAVGASVALEIFTIGRSIAHREIRMKCRAFALCLGLMVPLVARAQALPAPAASAEACITIDRSKNPEKVPEWAAWRFAFTQIGGPNRSGVSP